MKRIKQIAAIAGIILLLAMYGSTLVLAFSQSPHWFSWFIASLLCTFGVPVMIYVMEMFYRLIKGKDDQDEQTGQKNKGA